MLPVKMGIIPEKFAKGYKFHLIYFNGCNILRLSGTNE